MRPGQRVCGGGEIKTGGGGGLRPGQRVCVGGVRPEGAPTHPTHGKAQRAHPEQHGARSNLDRNLLRGQPQVPQRGEHAFPAWLTPGQLLGAAASQVG